MDDRIDHLKALLDRLEDARARLEAAPDAATAADVLGELNEVAQEVSAEVERQRRAVADDEGDDSPARPAVSAMIATFPKHLATAFDDVPRPARPRAPRHAADVDLEPFEDALWYPLVAGGKRLRPLLSLATVEALGGDTSAALPVAAALEWVHTFSLVHDDLPAIDDDELRRGRPTTHIRYGEDAAVLVGDALLNGAYGLVLERLRCPASRRAAVLAALFAGVDGMIAGQYLDVRPPPMPDEAWLRRMSGLKTGRLIQASVGCGLALVAPPAATEAAYLAFAEELGAGLPDGRRRARRDGHRRAARQAGRLRRRARQAHVRDGARHRAGARAGRRLRAALRGAARGAAGAAGLAGRAGRAGLRARPLTVRVESRDPRAAYPVTAMRTPRPRVEI